MCRQCQSKLLRHTHSSDRYAWAKQLNSNLEFQEETSEVDHLLYGTVKTVTV
jgi:hypothetical protein